MHTFYTSCRAAWKRERRLIFGGALLAAISGATALIIIMQLRGETPLVAFDRQVNRWANSKALYDMEFRPWVIQVMHWTSDLFSTLYVMVLLTLLTIVRLRK